MVRQAIDSDVHIIGISTLAGGHLTLIPQIISLLAKSQNREDEASMMVVIGGVIPEKDQAFLKGQGVDFIFGPGTNLVEAASNILDKFMKK